MPKRRAKFPGLACIAALLLGVSEGGAEAAETGLFEWNFSNYEAVNQWEVRNSESARTQEGVLFIAGRGNPMLSFRQHLRLPAEQFPVFKTRIKLPLNARFLRLLWMGGSAPRPQVYQLIESVIPTGEWQTVRFNLRRSTYWKGVITDLAFQVLGNDIQFEIASLGFFPDTCRERVAKIRDDFWTPQLIFPSSINSILSPRLGRRAFILYLNLIAFAVLLGGVLLYNRKKVLSRLQKRKIIARTSVLLLAIWLVYDLRETFNQYSIVKYTWNRFLFPRDGKPQFYDLKDFYSFVEVCRKVIPERSSFNFSSYSDMGWPFDLRMKYFLYPRRMKHENTGNEWPGQKIPYWVIFKEPAITFDPKSRRLVHFWDGHREPITETGDLVYRYGLDSFIFRED